MPVSIQKINIVQKHHNLGKNLNRIQVTLPGKPPCNLNPAHFPYYGKFSSVTADILGALSTEDMVKVNELKQEYSSKNVTELREIHKKAIEDYISDFKYMIKMDECNEPDTFVYKPVNLTKEIQKTLKQKELELIAMKQSAMRDCPKCNANYKEWFPSIQEIPLARPAKTIFEHPVDKALRLTGVFNAQDIEQIEKITDRYKDCPILNIIETKANILTKINEILCKKSGDFHGQFNNKDFDLLKNLAVEYRALNNIQSHYGYTTKALESVLFSDTKNLKCGEYIDGLGLITDELTVNGKDTVITFKYNQDEYLFRMYDKEKLKEKDKFLTDLPETTYLEDLNTINKMSKDIIQKEGNALVAEVRFKVMDINSARNFMKKNNLPEEYADKIMQDSKYAYLIQNFKNFQKRDYRSAARIIGTKLLKTLKDKDAFPIFLRAEPYDSTHSPVVLYLRSGFKPLSRTEKEVYDSINELGEYKGRSVIMYLQNFDENCDKIDTFDKLYFKNTVNN